MSPNTKAPKRSATTDEPFSKALQRLLDERGWSLRELHRRTQHEVEWGALSTLHVLLTAQVHPTTEAIERIASVFRVKPTYFAEYRLAKAREALDENQVGLASALRTYARFSR